MEIDAAVVKHFERVQIEKGTLEAMISLFWNMLKDENEECKKIEKIYGDIPGVLSQS
jgi:hypothetical protein